jgi:hypothetical protein
MKSEDFKDALFAIGRDRDEALYQRDALIVQMRLERRAANIQQEIIEEEISREVAGTGEIGDLCRRITELERKESDLYGACYKEALAENGRRLTAAGLHEAIVTVVRSSGSNLTMSGVETGLAVLGFDLGNTRNPRAAIANTLEGFVGSGRIRFVPDTHSYGIALGGLA